jgi:hypothetical protein
MDFMEAFRAAKKETFRLELLDYYLVAEEKDHFEAFKKDRKFESKSLLEWAKELETLREKGVKTKRVHVVSLPLSDYLKFEILEGYRKTFESIRLLSRKDYIKKFDNSYKDFWLIDELELFIVNYDKEGRWLDSDQVFEEEKIMDYVKLKAELLSSSEQIDKFLKINKIDLD